MIMYSSIFINALFHSAFDPPTQNTHLFLFSCSHYHFPLSFHPLLHFFFFSLSIPIQSLLYFFPDQRSFTNIYYSNSYRLLSSLSLFLFLSLTHTYTLLSLYLITLSLISLTSLPSSHKHTHTLSPALTLPYLTLPLLALSCPWTKKKRPHNSRQLNRVSFHPSIQLSFKTTLLHHITDKT